jgi:hypothetical protein
MVNLTLPTQAVLPREYGDSETRGDSCALPDAVSPSRRRALECARVRLSWAQFGHKLSSAENSLMGN